MTDAEGKLIEAILKASVKGEGYLGPDAMDAVEEMVLLVREERCPEKLLTALRSHWTAYDRAKRDWQAELKDLKLNYPPELVDAALSRVTRESR